MTSKWMAAFFAAVVTVHLAGTRVAAAQQPGTAAAQPQSAQQIQQLLDQLQTQVQQQAQQLQDQQKRLADQQSAIDALRRQIAITTPASVNTEAVVAAAEAPVSRAPNPVVTAKTSDTPGEGSPLSIKLGSGTLTPGGWADFTAYYRTTDVGSGLGTSFASIPFNNTVGGELSEARFSAQSSRFSLRADETFGRTKIFGYGEADFNGYLPSNAYVSTNSDSLRLRVYFTDVSRGKWELLAGQSWSLLTPNRVGDSPFLSEIYNTLHLDTNYQAGLTYARQAQFRVVYHATPHVSLGISAENPEQFSGSAATFPTLFSNTQTDVNSSTGSGGGTTTPTLHPDLIAKLSADARWAGRSFHFETAGLLSPVAIETPSSVTKANTVKDIREGGGISAVANLEVIRNLHLITTAFWSDGGGRYLGGLGPGFVVAQLGSKTAPFTAQLVHSGSAIGGLEWQATHSTLLSATFSGVYFSRVSSIDPSTGTLVGYGYLGSANSNNRAIEEATFASQTTLWKRAGVGAVQLITQSSYITRSPWYVAPGAPHNAHIVTGYANLRYVLP